MNGGANFTHKAQEAILSAQDLAREKGQQQIDALHLLYVLLEQEESIVLNLLERIGADIEGLKKRTKSALDRIPQIVTPQTFGQFYLTQDMAKVLDRAKQESIKIAVLYFGKAISGFPKYLLEFLRYLKPLFQSSLRNNIFISLSLLLTRDIISLRFCFDTVSIHS